VGSTQNARWQDSIVVSNIGPNNSRFKIAVVLALVFMSIFI
jgi:hypothetical protein